MNKMKLILLAVAVIGGGVLATLLILSANLPATKINAKDGAEMMLIPAGDFMMGTSQDELASLQGAHANNISGLIVNEMPQHNVRLSAFYMYKTEVTVAQFRKFCAATNRTMPREPAWKLQENYPIVNVTWDDAAAYAEWAGAALPTEAQWEKAARGTDNRLYPWGNDWDTAKSCNIKTSNGTAAATGSFPTGASPYGVMDMSGNVWEWCADWYARDFYNTATPEKNPHGPETGVYRVLRGGSWMNDFDENRSAYRNAGNPTYFNDSYGFRCVTPKP